MIKSITNLVLFFSIPLLSWCQNTASTTSPCTDALAQTIKGKWMKLYDNAGNITPVQKQEAYKRLDIIHNILLKIYPDPVGIDIRESRSAGIAYFGSTRKYRFTEDNELTFDYVKLLPIKSYSYFANCTPHYCAGSEFMPGSKNENSDGPGLSVNDLYGIAEGPASDDEWTINGFPIMSLSTVTNENWKGFKLYGDIRTKARALLIHREGMLPFIPVTRKQYLERCILVSTRMHDKIIEQLEIMPVRSQEEQEAEKKEKLAKFEKDFGKDPKRLKSAVDYYLSGYKTDQQIREDNITNAKKIKDQELKKFTDELEKSTKMNLLDSPAYIRVRYYSEPVFDINPQTGSMLIMENPDYIRKELPAYIPQFMVLTWKWSEFYKINAKIEKRFLQDFPVEKLQAMIDK